MMVLSSPVRLQSYKASQREQREEYLKVMLEEPALTPAFPFQEPPSVGESFCGAAQSAVACSLLRSKLCSGFYPVNFTYPRSTLHHYLVRIQLFFAGFIHPTVVDSKAKEQSILLSAM